MEHELKIKSLHDAMADCTCGWHYVGTGERTREEIEKLYWQHLEKIVFVKSLPYQSIMDGDALICALWKSAENICEYGSQNQPDPSNTDGLCDTSGLYYGTDDILEPRFCARHFYQIVVSGDGKSNYALVDLDDEGFPLCPEYKEKVLPDEKGNCSLCGKHKA